MKDNEILDLMVDDIPSFELFERFRNELKETAMFTVKMNSFKEGYSLILHKEHLEPILKVLNAKIPDLSGHANIDHTNAMRKPAVL